MAIVVSIIRTNIINLKVTLSICLLPFHGSAVEHIKPELDKEIVEMPGKRIGYFYPGMKQKHEVMILCRRSHG